MRRHPDYLEKLDKSGVHKMLAMDDQGRPLPGFNQKLAEEIANAENPALAAYEIALELLGETDDDDPAPSAAALAAATSTPATTNGHAAEPAKPATIPDPVVEAERRGARQVAERVVDNTTKPRGIRGLSDAGAPPRIELNDAFRQQLDGLMARDIGKFDAFMAKNPDIDDWFMERGRWAPTSTRR